MTHLGLFEGIGGFSLAARWMGWETLAWCEWNEFGQKVLRHHFPEAEGFGDITKTDFTKYANRIDILTGGFPCQPYSAAGKRLGKEDERHLWPEMLRVIREVQPSWVVGENVLGLVNWSGGLVFHEVQADLEAEGYEVFPFVLPACGVGAPHRRDRVWFVGHRKQSNGDSTSNGNSQVGKVPSKRTRSKKSSDSIGVCNGVIADSEVNGFTQSESVNRWEEHQQNNGDGIRNSLNADGGCRTTTDTNSKRYSSCGESQGIKRDGSGNNGESEKRSEQTEWVDGLHGFQRDPSDANTEYYYKCKCGYTFSEEYGKYGCANCGGEFAARLVTNTTSKRLERECRPIGELERGFGFASPNTRNMQRPSWDNFPTQSPIRFGDDGLSARLDGITFPKWRNESIKAAGNAIVPQVAFQIFKAIQESIGK